MIERVPSCLLPAADKVRRVYWRIAKPTRYGVKVLVTHPNDDQQLLLIRNTYGNREQYTLPGGGRKASEPAEMAARREVREELGLELGATTVLINESLQTAEGKRDYLTTIGGRALQEVVRKSPEIHDYRWVDCDEVEDITPLSRHVVAALAAYRSSREQ